jgi:hypothetical protein
MTQPKNPLVFDEKAAYLKLSEFAGCKIEPIAGITYSAIELAHWQHSKDNILLESALQMLGEMEEALDMYSDGRAFDFDRSIRGDVNFNHTLSSSTAKRALEKLSLWKKETGLKLNKGSAK